MELLTIGLEALLNMVLEAALEAELTGILAIALEAAIGLLAAAFLEAKGLGIIIWGATLGLWFITTFAAVTVLIG